MSSPSSHPRREDFNEYPVEGLINRLGDTHISSPSRSHFVGGFTSRDRVVSNPDGSKPLPPTPNPNIPLTLQPGQGGGRYVGYAQTPPSRPPVFPMPVPMISSSLPKMPSPTTESLTMTYARSAPPDVSPYPPPQGIPVSDTNLIPPNPAPHFYSSAPSSGHTSPAPKPSRLRASSMPPSPATSSSSDNGNTVQCAGTTKAGKRCARQVKSPPLVSFYAAPSSEPIERFCFQHEKEVLEPTGFYSHKAGGGWVKFEDWIPSYLKPTTQAALRVEMEKPSSSKDEPGYIYAYEIRDDRSPDEVMIKVGRAVKLVKRLDQWSKQCTSKEVILRGWWPGTVEHDEDKGSTSLLKGKVKAGEPGPLCHRLERLIHLELADLVVHAPYLESGFPKVDTSQSGSSSPPSTPGRSSKPSKAPMPNKPCIDCGSVHKEIFTFKRVKKGKYKNAEWERIVQPVIAKWGKFVAELV